MKLFGRQSQPYTSLDGGVRCRQSNEDAKTAKGENKMKAEVENGNQTIEIDTEGMEKRITEQLDTKMKAYMEKLKDYTPKESGGKGIVESYFGADKKSAVLEEFHKGEGLNTQRIKEQWTIAHRQPIDEGIARTGHRDSGRTTIANDLVGAHIEVLGGGVISEVVPTG